MNHSSLSYELFDLHKFACLLGICSYFKLYFIIVILYTLSDFNLAEFFNIFFGFQGVVYFREASI